MAFKSKSNLKVFDELCANVLAEEYRRTLSYLGEQCVNRIRRRSKDESWIDHTGNLRSSIGYAIYEEGKTTIRSAFDFGKGEEGKAVGEKYVEELATLYSDTFALVVVAGMNYADYVEAHENKDVLASTELWAKGKIEGYLQRTNEKVARRINKLIL